MLYEYLLTTFKVIVGLITTERLIYGAAIAIGFYVVWACFSLMFSFQKKFNRNCVKLYNFVRKNNLNANDVNSVDYKASKISSGFSHGWKKFKSSNAGKPSDFITRRDALDVEVTGGILNQGKTFMRTFINVATFILFLLNFAYLGNASSISCYLIAEAMVLPLVFFVICKIFYFLYTSIKQQLYKNDIESLYELLELLDQIFGKVIPSAVLANTSMQYVQGEDEVATTEGEELGFSDIVEDPEKEGEAQEVVEEIPQEEEEDDVATKYDIFKKKNIDVDKLLNEVPNASKTSLPYINVDSDYVIKDDDASAAAVSKTITNLENGSALLGGMMQDMSSIKKNSQKDAEETEKSNEATAEEKSDKTEKKDSDSEEVKVEDAESEEIKVDANVDEKAEEKTEDAKTEENAVDLFDALSAFEVAENVPAEEPKEEKTEEKQEDVVESQEEKKEEISETQDDEEIKLEIPDVEPIEIVKPEPEEVEEVVEEPEEISDEQRENIATVVGSFRPKSKLASGGVVIERNEPISRREKSTLYEAPQNQGFNGGYQDVYEENFNQTPNRGITQLSADNDADNILNTFRTSAGGYDDYQGYNNMQGGMYNQGYGVPQFNQGYGYGQPNFNQQNTQNFGVQGYQNNQMQNYSGYANHPYTAEGYDDADESFDESYDEVEEEIVEPKKPTKKPASKRSKEDEPRPRNLKKKESKPVMTEEVKTTKRGRPKKQVFDETVTIKNDKQFDEVLSRAEKLMKKSEEGLSASQAKRIEKELKMLMDAMNKYKEGV